MNTESKAKKDRRQHGQSLVEYALIIVLLAVVAIGVLLILGTQLQRVYGLVSAVLGQSYNTTGQHTLTITSAKCVALTSAHQTGLLISGNTDEPITDLMGSTELGGAPVSDNGSGFLYHPMVDSTTADTSKCPRGVVIQARDGSIAFAPVTRVSQ